MTLLKTRIEDDTCYQLHRIEADEPAIGKVAFWYKQSISWNEKSVLFDFETRYPGDFSINHHTCPTDHVVRWVITREDKNEFGIVTP